MAVVNIKSIRPSIWTPPKDSALPKIIVTRANGTGDDITDICHFFEYEDGVTDMIGTFTFEIWNPNETYTNVWTGMEVVEFYNNYSDVSDTKRFRGRIEKIAYRDNKVKVTGRTDALLFMEKTVTRSYADTECSTILKALITAYGTGFTSNNVTTSSVNLTVNWIEKPFWDCIRELCTAATFDCYIDNALDFHFFKTSSILNKGEAIVHDNNLMEVNDFTDDLTFVRNKIKVYGAERDEIQVLYTAEDATSQAAYGVREEVINDDSIIDETQAQEYADYQLANKKDPPQVGEVIGVMLATIQPGEKIRLSSPENNLPPGDYDILSFKQTVNFDRGYYTTVRVNKEPRRFSHIMKTLIESNNQQKEASLNPEEMNYSYNFLFDTDSGSHSNTAITNGILKPTAGAGTWISNTRTLGSNITEAYLIIVGTVLTGAAIYVSGNAGVDYELLTDKTKSTLATSIGTSLKVKVIFSDATTEVDSLSILYKLS